MPVLNGAKFDHRQVDIIYVCNYLIAEQLLGVAKSRWPEKQNRLPLRILRQPRIRRGMGGIAGKQRMLNQLPEDSVPYFAWDRNLPVSEIKRKLAESANGSDEWLSLTAWIMREAAFEDVWLFLEPNQVFLNFDKLKHKLGMKFRLWDHILRTWHELGKI